MFFKCHFSSNSFPLSLIKLLAGNGLGKTIIKKRVLHDRYWEQQWLHTIQACSLSASISSPLPAVPASPASPWVHTQACLKACALAVSSALPPRSTAVTSLSSFEFPSNLTFSLRSNLTTLFTITTRLPPHPSTPNSLTPL